MYLDGMAGAEETKEAYKLNNFCLEASNLVEGTEYLNKNIAIL